MELNIFAISGLAVFMTCVLMGATLLLVGKTAVHRLWGVFCFFVAVWGIGSFLFATTDDISAALRYWKFSHVGVIFIPAVFAHFVYVFLEKKSFYYIYFSYLLSFFFLCTAFFSGALLTDLHIVFNDFYYITATPLYSLFLSFFIGTAIYTHVLLYLAFKSANAERRLQIQYFFIASFIGFFGGSLSFVPAYGINIYPYLNFSTALYPLIMGYAIFRYKLFDVRVVTTVLFVVLLLVFLLTRVFVADPYSLDQLFDIVLFVATAATGAFLVRSVLNEIRAREQVERLAKQLEGANERLKELDRLKNEFLSIASHQLRAPITAIRGYSSLMLEGEYGAMPDPIREPIQRIVDSARNMANSIEDYLNVSRIEQGRMKYEKSNFDLADLAKKTAEELRPVATRRSLDLSVGGDADVMVNADVGKIKQVISNLIDNAIKYTEKGSIKVEVKKEGSNARVVVSDTGIGIPREEINSLFEKFKRARDANKVNTTGTGLGLYVAKQLVEGHAGKIWVESDGPGKGSRFIVELPI